MAIFLFPSWVRNMQNKGKSSFPDNIGVMTSLFYDTIPSMQSQHSNTAIVKERVSLGRLYHVSLFYNAQNTSQWTK